MGENGRHLCRSSLHLRSRRNERNIDALSISYLNALEYCPRRFYYECALSEFVDNAHVVEGIMRHERSDSGRTTTEDGVTTLRRVWQDKPLSPSAPPDQTSRYMCARVKNLRARM